MANVYSFEICLFSTPAAAWLEKEAKEVVSTGALADLLWEQCTEDVAANALSPTQERLVGCVCKLPDVVAGRMGREVSPNLLPRAFFSRLATCVHHCLEKLHLSLKGKSILWDRTSQCVLCVCLIVLLPASRDCSVLFVAEIVGRACFLGNSGQFPLPLNQFPLLTKPLCCSRCRL